MPQNHDAVRERHSDFLNSHVKALGVGGKMKSPLPRAYGTGAKVWKVYPLLPPSLPSPKVNDYKICLKIYYYSRCL